MHKYIKCFNDERHCSSKEQKSCNKSTQKTKKHITSIEGGLCTDDGKLFLKLLRARNNTTPYKIDGVRRNC